MPTPTNNYSELHNDPQFNHFFAGDFLKEKGYTTGPKVPIEETPFGKDPLIAMGKRDDSEVKASKELGKLAVFMTNNYSKNIAEAKPGETLVDVVISLLKK